MELVKTQTRRFFPLIALIVLGVGFYCIPTQADSDKDKPKEKPPVKGALYKPVVDIEVIMHKVDDIYAEIEENLEKKRLRTIKKDAAFLAEMMNITQHFQKEKAWKDFSVKSRDILLKMHQAASKKDQATTAKLYKEVDAVCEGCHDKYDV